MKQNLFSERLKSLIESSGETYSTIAKNTGLSQGGISEFCSGDKRNIRSDSLIKLCKYFGVSSDWLLGLTDANSTDSDIKSVCNYTGLSANTVSYLHNACPSFYHSFIRKLFDSIVHDEDEENGFVNSVVENTKRAALALRIARHYQGNDDYYKNIFGDESVTPNGEFLISPMDAYNYFSNAAKEAFLFMGRSVLLRLESDILRAMDLGFEVDPNEIFLIDENSEDTSEEN